MDVIGINQSNVRGFTLEFGARKAVTCLVKILLSGEDVARMTEIARRYEFTAVETPAAPIADVPAVPIEVVVVAGDHTEASDFCRRSRINPHNGRVAFLFTSHHIMGISNKHVYLTGTYRELADWPEIEAILDVARSFGVTVSEDRPDVGTPYNGSLT